MTKYLMSLSTGSVDTEENWLSDFEYFKAAGNLALQYGCSLNEEIEDFEIPNDSEALRDLIEARKTKTEEEKD